MIAKLLRSSPSDIICYGYLRSQESTSGLVGTLIFRLKAALFGIQSGKGVKCYGPVNIMRKPGSRISIGNGVHIVSSSRRCSSGSLYAPTKLRTLGRTAEIVIEDCVGLNGTSITARTRSVVIGAGTIIAPNVVIMDSDFHALWPPENRIMNPATEKDANVTIGRNVWIGAQCMIKKGVRVGDNAVIAAGSVVTRDVPENTLAGGNPAKVIRALADF